MPFEQGGGEGREGEGSCNRFTNVTVEHAACLLSVDIFRSRRRGKCRPMRLDRAIKAVLALWLCGVVVMMMLAASAPRPVGRPCTVWSAPSSPSAPPGPGHLLRPTPAALEGGVSLARTRRSAGEATPAENMVRDVVEYDVLDMCRPNPLCGPGAHARATPSSAFPPAVALTKVQHSWVRLVSLGWHCHVPRHVLLG